MRKKILMFGWEFPPFNSGGLGVACLGLTRALSGLEYEVLFVMPKKLDITTPWARMIFADESGAPIKGYAINSWVTPYATGTSVSEKSAGSDNGIYAGDLFSEVERYRSEAAGIALHEDFDIIYAHDWLSFGAGMEAKKATGKPLIVHVHATEFDRCGGAQGVNEHVYGVERDGMMMADRVIAVSEYTKQIIVRYYGIPESKVQVVYNGIDGTTLGTGNGARRLKSFKESGYKIVLFLGRLTLQKGPDYFLRAAKRVLEKNSKVLFVVSGSGDMAQGIMEMAARLGIAGNVLFTGFVSGSDRTEMYTAADLFVMPSVSEPFGIAPLESMKLGTPVLISKQSGVAEVVRHALKVDFWDVDEMANMMLAAVGLPQLRATLSGNARTEADNLTWNDAARKIDTIVQELAR